MLNPFSRTELLLGRDAMERLASSRVADIYKTRVNPPARVMRRELKKRGIRKLKVVYSEEQPLRPIEDMAISCRAHCICPPGTKRHCTNRRDRHKQKNAAARFPSRNVWRRCTIWDGRFYSHSCLRQTNAFQLPYSRGGGVLGGFHHADLPQRDGFRQVDPEYGMSPVFL